MAPPAPHPSFSIPVHSWSLLPVAAGLPQTSAQPCSFILRQSPASASRAVWRSAGGDAYINPGALCVGSEHSSSCSIPLLVLVLAAQGAVCCFSDQDVTEEPGSQASWSMLGKVRTNWPFCSPLMAQTKILVLHINAEYLVFCYFSDIHPMEYAGLATQCKFCMT